MFLGARKGTFKKAAELRAKMTPAENKLWQYLRTKPHGHKFRRQHPISKYIVDFYFHSLQLIVEVDGGIHNSKAVKENDIVRQEYLESEGLKFLRITNDDLENGYSEVIQLIEQFVVEYNNQ